ncbi:MAG: ketoacyl-ACP synthase III [Prolixibacteraceae bacterium]|nr:ketoacyl-ACP synthase III [Prolixibacteraceae bacterium]
MKTPHARISGIAAYVPEYRLTNNELSKMIDTTDEWIMQRIGIKERRILIDSRKATSDLAVEAIGSLLKKTQTLPDDVDMLICATITPDMPFPATANIICEKLRLNNAWGYDISAACSGFIYALVTAAQFVETGRYKKIVVVGAEKMSSIVNYQDRAVSPLFGDGAGAVMVEPAIDENGVIDHIFHVDGAGRHFLHQKAGGSLNPASHHTVDNKMHFIFQEGQTVFKFAVSRMAEVAAELMQKNGLTHNDLAWLVPHQANMRIISATTRHIGIDANKVMINIEKYGNTTAATIPLCLADYESQLKKGDKIILVAFGAGFTWGGVYLKWAI